MKFEVYTLFVVLNAEAEEAEDDDDEEEEDGIRYSLPAPNSRQVEPTTSGGIEVRRRNPVRSSQIKNQQKLNRMSWL